MGDKIKGKPTYSVLVRCWATTSCFRVLWHRFSKCLYFYFKRYFPMWCFDDGGGERGRPLPPGYKCFIVGWRWLLRITLNWFAVMLPSKGNVSHMYRSIYIYYVFCHIQFRGSRFQTRARSPKNAPKKGSKWTSSWACFVKLLHTWSCLKSRLIQ